MLEAERSVAMNRLVKKIGSSSDAGVSRCPEWARRIIALDASVLRLMVILGCFAFWLVLLFYFLN